jgi:hypothetical protein
VLGANGKLTEMQPRGYKRSYSFSVAVDMSSRVAIHPHRTHPTPPEATPPRHGSSSTSAVNSICQSIDVSRYAAVD